MKAEIVKYFFSLGYTIRQTAIISEVSEDYVRKILSGKRAQSIQPNAELVTEGMRKRAKVIDYVMSLKGADFIEGTQKYNYISLLSYMGFTVGELKLIYPLDRASFVSIAALRSGEAWKGFDATAIGLSQEDYNFTFVDKVATYEAQIEKTLEGSGFSDVAREQRRQKKMANRNRVKGNI